MISGAQIRAARALLNWNAEELSNATGLMKSSISNIENGHTRARDVSLGKIIQAFKNNGIEFLGETGVRLQENYRIIDGEDCYLKLLDEIFYSTHNTDLEVFFICVDDAVSSPEVVAANQRIRDGGARCRYLASSSAKKFDFDLQDYRLIPEQYYRNSVMVIYEDKVATLRGTNDAVLIIKDKEQADMLRGLSEVIWAQAPAPQKEIER